MYIVGMETCPGVSSSCICASTITHASLLNNTMDSFADIRAVLTPENAHNDQLMKAVPMYMIAKILLEVYKDGVAKEEQKKKRRVARKHWAEPYLQRRLEQGHYNNLMAELAQESPELFRNYTRTSRPLFDEIVERVTPYI